MSLQFAPFSSQISSSFWSNLARVKVDQLQLSEEKIAVKARYAAGRSVVDRTSGESVALPVALSLDADSLESGGSAADRGESSNSSSQASSSLLESGTIEVVGELKNFNTIEEFKITDKGAMLDALGDVLLDVIRTDAEPLQKLNNFVILSFADLKKYKFIYWLAYPALLSRPGWRVEGEWKSFSDVYADEKSTSFASEIAQFSSSNAGYFLLHPSGKLGSVMDYRAFFEGVPDGERTVCFIDPSPHRTMPGWPLRNLLTLLNVRFDVERIRVLCWKSDPEGSVLVDVVNVKGSVDAGFVSTADQRTLPVSCRSDDKSKPSTVGWERNASGKLGPKLADLGPLMDPKRLADQAVDLNLKLMRWRILPEIDLEKVQKTRCLLLGAGTLGCYVARTLLGWGVRKITFVDSSTVSFSNPVRQPLFEFQDSLQGGKPKAQCAAESLQRIYPGVESNGHQLYIPMPGHPIAAASVKKAREDVALLEELMEEHDVVYLLMDSRESRWLPTVMGAAKGKLVMNTALGFDTFLGMRHGASPKQHSEGSSSSSNKNSSSSSNISNNNNNNSNSNSDNNSNSNNSTSTPSSHHRLGCYFCNDIVAPTDSLTDRTLDQMCTVTRPGLASIASAMTVELMVSVLQHPQGILAGAYSNQNAEASILGHLPHQLRGSLFTFNTLLIQGPAYDKCTACSPTVIEEYEAHGFNMIQRACDDETYLRSLTGLDKLYDATNDIEVDWSDDDDEGIGGQRESDEEADGELL